MSSLVAVAGTLAGATLTFLFGLVAARRSQRIARTERLHQQLQVATADLITQFAVTAAARLRTEP